MSENGMNYLELVYEHLYNMRDQTMSVLWVTERPPKSSKL